MSQRFIVKQRLERKDKTVWMSMGSAFLNEPTEKYPNPSIKIYLDAIPMSGELTAFLPDERGASKDEDDA